MERAGKPLVDKVLGKLRTVGVHVDRQKLEALDKPRLMEFAEALDKKAGADNG